ncbi:hypothetical protein [Streptomyces sp. AS02]|uniref:hypothetical protein n=1 Tax=Streptomyces sp. AS02 TaxID=2938946 RepID=UPI00201FCEFD|nr:hypothetical protein [Streptomyces sp. AS02]MCL8016963.1 hypothetical protein [Streptomyces sp. AS02]
MDIGQKLQQLEARLTKVERSARLSHASLDGTSLVVKDGTGTVRGHIGMQPDGTIGLIAENGPAPGAPTAPVITPSLGGLRVVWDGALADGSTLPADFDHVAVHVSTSSGFTPSAATFAGTITRSGDGGMLPVTPLPYALHYVRLVAVNTSAAESSASAETSATPLKVDGPDLQAGSVTSATIQAGAITADKLEAILQLVTRIVAGNPAGARVELNEDGLRVYNGSGVLVIRFDSADGSAVFTGNITGSTITGGTMTGAVFQTDTTGERITLNEGDENKILIYNSSGAVIGELSAFGLGLVGSTGATMTLDPNALYPTLRMTNSAGTNQAVMNVFDGTAGAADLGLNSGKFTASGLDWKWRTMFGNDFWVAERVRDGATTTNVGGRITLFNDRAVIGYNDTTNATEDSSLYLFSGYAQLVTSRFEVYAPASSSPALFANAASGHTGALLRLLLNGAEKFLVDKDGNVTAAGNVTSTPVTTTSGLSAATGFATNNFYGYKIGKLVVVDLYMNRTGATITATSGNITPDVAIATLPAGWRPTHSTINGHWDDGTASGGWVVGTDGICTLRTASSDIANNRNLRLHITFIQD